MKIAVSEDLPFDFYLCSSYLSVPGICTETGAFSNTTQAFTDNKVSILISERILS